MKLSIFIFLLSFKLFALEYSAGMRESYLVPNNYFFGSDSSARIRKALKNQGFRSFTLNTRLNLNNGFYISHAPLKSSLSNLETMISLIRFGRGETVIKPTLMKGSIANPKLDYADDSRLSVLFSTYQREISRYFNLSRKTSFETFIVGAGVGVLYKENIKQLDSFHKYLRKSLSEDTELVLAIDNIDILNSLNQKTLKSIKDHFDGVSYQVGVQINLDEFLFKLTNIHDRYFSGLKLSLSNVVMTSSQEIMSHIKIIKQYDLDIVEFLMSTTDYEPDDINDDYYYYRNDPFIISSSDDDLRVLSSLETPKENKPLVCIYFDLKDSDNQKDRLGRIHSTMLTSLLGAFSQYNVKRTPLGKYKAGDLFNCEKAFYLATHFSAEIPAIFLENVSQFMREKDFMWMNYKFSKLKDEKLGFNVPYVLIADQEPTRSNHDIGFYQYFDYKGETFFKKSGWSLVSDSFLSSPEINYIQIENKDDVTVLSTARHNKEKKKIPYIVKQDIDKGRIWYVADSPFAFVHYEDRYLILTDILWDFLEVTPPSGSPKALVRIEDVNPSVKMSYLNWAMTYLYQEDVPFSLALIPYFSDIIGATHINDYKPIFAPITRFPEMKSSLKYARALEADFVFHGVAHQVDDYISGYTGVSGSDYEFWLYPENVPVPYDSVDWVMDRLEKGEDVFRELGIRPSAWEIPHYAASVLDYKIFGKIFEWTYHRPVVFDHKILSDTYLPSEYRMFDCLTDKCKEDRRAYLRNIKVEADYADFGAALYPYPIKKDVYGQAIIPETLGMVDFAFYSPNTWRPVSNPKDILRRARKLKVIRGAMASFFWHPQLLNEQARYYLERPESYDEMGGQNSLKTIIKGLKDMGYKFISISDCKHFPQQGCRK